MKASNNLKINYPKKHKCKVCGLELSNYNYTNHFKKHNLTKEQYFRKFMPTIFKDSLKVGNYSINKQKFRNEWNRLSVIKNSIFNNVTYKQLKFILYIFALEGTVKGNVKLFDAVFKYWFNEYTFEECLERWQLLKNFDGVKSENLEYLCLRWGETLGKQKFKDKSERVKGSKNPAYNHGGKYSPLSDKFIHKDKVDKNEIINKISESCKTNGNHSTTLEYWLKRGYDLEAAKEKLSSRQKTFSLEKCIEKYGEAKGKERWKKRQEKWLKNFKFNNFSMISQDLFWNLSNELKSLKNIYFAELDSDKQMDKSGKNNEYRLVLEGCTILPDFIDIKRKKIIEFQGSYYHSESFLGEIGIEREKKDVYRRNKMDMKFYMSMRWIIEIIKKK